MQLPRPLEPWREWLCLLDAELGEPLGQLLLQLHPVIGRLNAAAPSPDALPVGIGNIVRRGPYERLLMSEWAYADVEPDEFIRRAGSAELLFAGPEPQVQRSARLCVALFDAGPAQLGEPRLAHLALFILLARRAQEAGAQFRWGVLQQPGSLHEESGKAALRALFAARTPELVSAAHCEQWNGAPIEGLRDCWHIGAADGPVPAQVTAHAHIACPLLGEGLQLNLTQNRHTRVLALRLPAPDIGVRLLRHPFGKPAPSKRLVLRKGKPSQKQAPRFSIGGSFVASSALDGGAIVFHVPQSSAAPAGRPRLQGAPALGGVLAAAVFKKTFAQIVGHADTLHFRGFPSQRMGQARQAERPPMQQFRAPPGMGRWLPTFFLGHALSQRKVERVIVLDIEKQLVAWEVPASRHLEMQFVPVEQGVIGAEQFGAQLQFARSRDGKTEILCWMGEDVGPTVIDSVAGQGRRALFGGGPWRGGGRHALIAIEHNASHWQVIDQAGAQKLSIADGASVLGVAAAPAEQGGRAALVVLDRARKQLYLQGAAARVDLLRSEAPLAQVGVDAASGRLCWITSVPQQVCVRELFGSELLMCAQAEDADDT